MSASVQVHTNSNISEPKSTISVDKGSKTQAPSQKRPWLHFVAGGSGGFIGTVLFSPLEVIKTRFQSSIYQHNLQNPLSKASFLQTARFHVTDTIGAIGNLYRSEGGRALFKGLGPTLMGSVPSRSIYFYTYGNGKAFITELNHGKETALVHVASAFVAGSITTTLTNPIWVVRTRLQLQSEQARAYRNSLHCVTEIVKKEGARSLFKGLSASYLGVGETVLQWVVYEKLKQVVHGYKNPLSPSLVDSRAEKATPVWVDTFLCAAVAKLCAAMVAYPHEVLRTRLRQNAIETTTHGSQFKYTSLAQCLKLVYREEGFRGFYGGLTPHLLRVVPNAAVLFGTYEMIMHYFG